ncbi:NAD-dependent epimerase/dehydratase family protein [Siccirubricoccus phaeus]|uniref:NAD-dependent epimerase/dehydratase family protein n=1 Tax=Siccirubricoccus phaeus TaxID=2595053 RepID=UPI0011F25FA8|nr:NAD-dependent epimerase/dehydratase family protein [Siccirubricoccus phaeus]
MKGSPLAAVTGGTGFLGRHVLAALAREGWRLRVLVRRDAQRPDGIAAPDIVRGDLTDADALHRLVQGAQAVVHLAGLTKARRRSEFLAVNRDGSARLAAAVVAAAPGARCILVSSLAAREPRLSAYAESKQAGEAAAIAALEDRVPWVVLRPSVIYGPGDREGIALCRLATARIVPVPRPPEPRITFVHAADVAAAIATLCHSGPAGARFEVTDGQHAGYEWQEVLRLIGEYLQHQPRFLPVPDIALLAAGAVADAWAVLSGNASLFGRGKAREVLHRDWSSAAQRQLPSLVWTPRVTLRSGLRETVAWWATLGLPEGAHA